MLGLRSLYFVLAGVVERFRYLRVGLAAILIFFGARLLLSGIIEVPNHVSLGLIAAALGLSVIASIKWPGRSLPDGRPRALIAGACPRDDVQSLERDLAPVVA